MRPLSHRSTAALLVAALFLACCTSTRGPDGLPDVDPCERVNRKLFWFNLKVDDYLLGPASAGWAFITPAAFRTALSRFFFNLGFPVRLVSNLGQGKGRHAGRELGRFVVNTTLGLAGFFDPAGRLGLVASHEDLGQMLGRWGIGSGPYWMLPLLGPSGPRDATGWLFDTALHPVTWLSLGGVPGIGAVDTINTRAIRAEDIELAREAALDYYVFVRSAYLQRREAEIGDSEVEPDEARPPRPNEDLYEIEDEPDDEP